MRALFVILAIGVTALLSGAVLSGPTWADQDSGNTFSLLGAAAQPGTAGSPLFLPAKYGGGGGGRSMAFHGGGHRGHHHRGAFFGGAYLGAPLYSSPYWSSGGGEGYYTEGNNVCVWNGYEYSCYQVY